MRYYLAKQIEVIEPDFGVIRKTAVSKHITRPDSYNDINASPFPRSLATGRMLTIVYDPTIQEHADLIADPDITYLPLEDNAGNPVTGALLGVPANKRNEVFNLLEANGVPATGTPAIDTVEELIDTVIKRFLIRQMLKENDFTENLGDDVSAIAQGKRDTITATLSGQGFSPNMGGTVRQVIKSLVDDPRWQ